MKQEAKKSKIMNDYYCQTVGYCNLQNLFESVEPDYYTCGVYGWYADVYTNGNLAIVTGCVPFGERYFSSEEIKEWNARARFIDRENLPWEERAKKKSELCSEFWKEFRTKVINKR